MYYGIFKTALRPIREGIIDKSGVYKIVTDNLPETTSKNCVFKQRIFQREVLDYALSPSDSLAFWRLDYGIYIEKPARRVLAEYGPLSLAYHSKAADEPTTYNIDTPHVVLIPQVILSSASDCHVTQLGDEALTIAESVSLGLDRIRIQIYAFADVGKYYGFPDTEQFLKEHSVGEWLDSPRFVPFPCQNVSYYGEVCLGLFDCLGIHTPITLDTVVSHFWTSAFKDDGGAVVEGYCPYRRIGRKMRSALEIWSKYGLGHLLSQYPHFQNSCRANKDKVLNLIASQPHIGEGMEPLIQTYPCNVFPLLTGSDLNLFYKYLDEHIRM